MTNSRYTRSHRQQLPARKGKGFMVSVERPYVGVGVYSISDAARLTRLSQAQVRHWINGYVYRTDGKVKRKPPVLHRQLPILDDNTALGFLDLVEMRVIAALLDKDFSLQWIRGAHQN